MCVGERGDPAGVNGSRGGGREGGREGKTLVR